MQVSALNKLAFVAALMKGAFPDAEEHLVDAERLAQSCNDLAGLAELHMTYCYVFVATGDLDGALGHQKESLQIGQDHEDDESRLFGMVHIANTMAYLARFDVAWERGKRLAQKAEELGKSQVPFRGAHLPDTPLSSSKRRHGSARVAAEEGMNIGGPNRRCGIGE